jgi:hypothetical protein
VDRPATLTAKVLAILRGYWAALYVVAMSSASELPGLGNLVGCDDAGANRSEGVERLAEPAACLPSAPPFAARQDVDEAGIAENMLSGRASRSAGRPSAGKVALRKSGCRYLVRRKSTVEPEVCSEWPGSRRCRDPYRFFRIFSGVRFGFLRKTCSIRSSPESLAPHPL